jgi:hypothetical protein
MSDVMETKLKITSWDEKPYRELPGGAKLTRAEVTLSGSADGLESGSFDALMYYRADGTSTYVAVMHLIGSVGRRHGSFVLQGEGTFDGTTARMATGVVPGSGTGELTGLTGRGESASTHADYPFMPLTLTYAFE